MTGLPNHGAVVGELAVAIESVRLDGTSIGVALIDVDNFTLVNETYGHAAGDSGAPTDRPRDRGTGCPKGRSPAATGRTSTSWSRPRRRRRRSPPWSRPSRSAWPRRASTSKRPNACRSPSAPGSPSTRTTRARPRPCCPSVAVELAAAKASGGDATRIAGDFGEAPALAGGFDVLQGLVFAVDTKDRYTKRHSEDVARYSVFLARLLKLDPELIEGIRSAGLLHDVGKIGIPNSVLRKPGRLTAEENEIVKQHVALGDSIVRNVDKIDLVRAGIRHHHERWDGRGYLDALAGEDIPLVARILAVADAFSAMTTTRPYRKALSVEEALRRLGDAAGTQLDERLAGAFIHGIETVADAPLPDQAGSRSILWVPRAQIA